MLTLLAFEVLAAIAQAVGAQVPLRERLLERARQGDAQAQYDLGVNYETGRIGLPKDMAQARHWYEAAAAQGDAFAEAALGILYHFGKGVSQSNFEALVWYERALAHLSGGDRDSVAEMRDDVAAKLSAEEADKARRIVKERKK